MNEKQIREVFRWIRDCEIEINSDGQAVLSQHSTIKLYHLKEECGNFLACQWMDKPLADALRGGD